MISIRRHAETGKLRQDIDALNQLRKTQEQQFAAAAAARPPAPGPSAAAVAEQQATQDAQRRQIADLQQQVAQRSHDLNSARGETVKLREGLDALAPAAQVGGRGRNATEGAGAANGSRRGAAGRGQTDVSAAAPHVSPTRCVARDAAHIGVAYAPPASAPPAAPPQPASPQLLTARQWLATGRPDEARRVLAMVQTRMVLQPVTPDRPAAEGGNPSATDVGNAIRWLDIGANGQAMQAIDRAIGNANAPVSSQPWSGYPPPRLCPARVRHQRQQSLIPARDAGWTTETGFKDEITLS